MVTTKLLTVEDFEEMVADGRRYELIRGELRDMAAAGGRHGRIGITVSSRLWNHVQSRELGAVYGADTGFVFARDPAVVYVPDVAFVLTERLASIVDIDRFVPFPPDLAVEVVSPSDRFVEVAEKVAAYLDGGVRLVWVIEPQRQTVTVYAGDRSVRVLGTDDTLDGGDVLPDFRLRVAEIFAF